MANTQQEEENSFIAWLKWLLGLDEELEKDNHDNIEEIKKRYKEITKRDDLKNVESLDDIKNLENANKIKEEVEKEISSKNVPIDLFKDIDKIEKDIDMKKNEIKKEDLEKKQKDYDEARKAYNTAVKYKTDYNDINDKIEQNKKNIESLENRNKEIENSINSLENYSLLKEYIKNNNMDIDNELNSDIETRIPYRGNTFFVLNKEKKEECKRIKDFIDIQNLIKSGKLTKEEVSKLRDQDESYGKDADDEENKKIRQVKNYFDILDSNKEVAEYFENLEKIEEAKKTAKILEDEKKEKYSEEPDENEINRLKDKMDEAQKNLNDSKQKVNEINDKIKEDRKTIRKKINEKYPESSENYTENREKMEMAVQIRELAKDSNLKVSMVGAYNAASNYKPKFHLFGEKGELYRKEVEAMKVRDTAKKEMLKREGEGLCGDPEHFAINLWNTIADIEKRHPISSSDKGMDFFSLSEQISAKYKEYYKENSTTEEQFEAAKRAFKEVVDNLGDSKINEKFLKEINYKFNKGIGLYLESKETYMKANENYAKLCSKNLIKNGLKDRYKKDKQEIKNEYKNKKSKIKNEIKEKAKVYKERKQQLKEKEKELKKLQKKRMGKIKNKKELNERNKELEKKRIRADELKEEIEILKGSGEGSIKEVQEDYRKAKNSKWVENRKARETKNNALKKKEEKFKEDRKNLREQHKGLINNLEEVNTVDVKNVKKVIKSNSKEEVKVNDDKKITINLKNLSKLTVSESSTVTKSAPNTPTNPNMNRSVNGPGMK